MTDALRIGLATGELEVPLLGTRRTMVAAHCYGSYDQSVRDTVEWEGIQQYADALEDIVRELALRRRNIELRFYGGMKDAKGTLEADSFVTEFRRRLRDLHVQRICSIVPSYEKSTIGIMRQICRNHDAQLGIYVVCDTWRKPKCELLLSIFRKKYRMQGAATIIGLPRKDSHPNSTVEFQKREEWLIRHAPELLQWWIERGR